MRLTGKSLRVAVTTAVLAIAFGGLLYSTLSGGTECFTHDVAPDAAKKAG
jgi:hypothetical protein